MKIIKSVFYVAGFAFVFTGCKSIQSIAVPTGIDNGIDIPAKNVTLTKEMKNAWSSADIETDSIAGMSLEKAYDFLKDKNGVEVIVGIADSGVDIEHEDLKDVAWVNAKEIPNNDKDDDKNGYVDDIHGWNFLGNKAGEIVNADQLEITRIVKRGMDKFGSKTASEISENEKAEYEEYLKIKEKFDKVAKSKEEEIKNLNATKERILQIESSFLDVQKFMGKSDFTAEDLQNAKTDDAELSSKIANVSMMMGRGMNMEELQDYKKRLLEYVEGQEKAKSYDLDFDKRQTLGDNLYDITDVNYGNSNVIGSKELESHGTHVAGIVAATRGNDKGLDGVANNVKILTVRVVPDGDEHDKDVALGIRYAVDNGAKVINTSFGKGYSPNKQWVYDAIKYAAKNDVLIVNAAGNDSKNIDVEKTYPNDSEDLVNEISDNVLTIGASSLFYDKRLPARFSNFGKINVDVFAPGVDIYSTIPSDEYDQLSGTSMAAPSAAGVAALVRSYYPKLSASQVKGILMNSGVKINFDVIKPGSQTRENPEGDLVPFSELSVSGRIVNAYNALKMADKMVNKK